MIYYFLHQHLINFIIIIKYIIIIINSLSLLLFLLFIIFHTYYEGKNHMDCRKKILNTNNVCECERDRESIQKVYLMDTIFFFGM